MSQHKHSTTLIPYGTRGVVPAGPCPDLVEGREDAVPHGIANNHHALVPAGARKDHKSRLTRYADWLDDAELSYLAPDLAAYRDHLLAGDLKPSTVSAHLSTIRGRYKTIARDPKTRDAVIQAVADKLGPAADLASVMALANEHFTRLEHAVDPKAARVKVTKVQDRAHGEQLRLTPAQANRLLVAPGLDTVKGVRDTALIALLLCTGIREGEAVGLDAADLRQHTEDGELALLVRHGKGDKQRLVPYGELDFCLLVVDAWLTLAGITAGRVFRPVNRWGSVTGDAWTTRSLQRTLEGYPLTLNGTRRYVRPHDMRRTYARLQYEAGMDLVSIQQNLGHASYETTLGYIGELDTKRRRGRGVYTFDIDALERIRALM